jgi:hypothetical protein
MEACDHFLHVSSTYPYMDAIEEIINIPILLERLNVVVAAEKVSNIMEEIIAQSRVEFKRPRPDPRGSRTQGDRLQKHLHDPDGPEPDRLDNAARAPRRPARFDPQPGCPSSLSGVAVPAIRIANSFPERRRVGIDARVLAVLRLTYTSPAARRWAKRMA